MSVYQEDWQCPFYSIALPLLFARFRFLDSEKYMSLCRKFINILTYLFTALLIRLIFNLILSFEYLKEDETFDILMSVGNHSPPIFKIYKPVHKRSQFDYVNFVCNRVIPPKGVHACAINNVNILRMQLFAKSRKSEVQAQSLN